MLRLKLARTLYKEWSEKLRNVEYYVLNANKREIDKQLELLYIFSCIKRILIVYKKFAKMKIVHVPVLAQKFFSLAITEMLIFWLPQ